MNPIRQHVQTECQSSANALGPAFFDQHLSLVAEYARDLAETLAGDARIVEPAAWLHDIAAVRDIATLPEHPVRSAEIARELLLDQGREPALVERVAQCIRSHSTPIAMSGGTIEEVCLSNADAMSQIARPAYWLYFAFGVRKLGYVEGRQWLRDHLEKNWAKLIPVAKEVIEDEYRRARELLG